MTPNLKKYTKDIDKIYLDSMDDVCSELRKGINDCDDAIHKTTDSDHIDMLEEEITFMQELLKASQHNQVFVESSPPSGYVVPILKENFTTEEIESILGFVQSELYNKFMDVSIKAEQEYNDKMIESVTEFNESLKGRVM